MKTCKCGFTGEDDQFDKGKNICLPCRREQKRKSYHNKTQLQKEIRNAARRTNNHLLSWINKKDRSFMMDYNKDENGVSRTIVDHSKCITNVVVIHSQHKKRKAE